MENPQSMGYNDLTKLCEKNSSKSNYYMWGVLQGALQEQQEPSKYVPQNFKMQITDTSRNITNISFKNIKWNTKGITSFDAKITQDNIPPVNISASRIENSIEVTFEIESTQGMKKETWTKDSDVSVDDISLDEVIQKYMKGVNPIDIMGSTQLNIGDARIAFLDMRYDETGNLKKTVDNKQFRWTGFVTPSERSFPKNEGTEHADGVTNPVQQKVLSTQNTGKENKKFEIDYGITTKDNETNNLKQSLFDIEQTAESFVKNELWNNNVRDMDKQELAANKFTIEKRIETHLKNQKGLEVKIESEWGQEFSCKDYAKFSLNGNKIVSENEFVSQNGTKLTNAEFILKNDKLQIVNGNLTNADNTTEIKTHIRNEPKIEEHKTFIGKTWGAIKTGVNKIYTLATSWHFEGRDKKNVNLPNYQEIDSREGWREVPEWQAGHHQNGTGKPEIKYVNKDGREVIYDGDTHEIVNNPKTKPSYNYCTVSAMPKKWYNAFGWTKFALTGMGHYVLDVAPYAIGGNVRGKN